MAKSRQSEAQNAPPSTGDKVTVGDGTSEWTISSVSHDGSEVNLHIPGTNLERSDLKFVDRAQPAKPAEPAPPAKPKLDIAEIKERIGTVHQGAIEHLTGEVAILKKYLKSKGVSQAALGQLDDLVESEEKRWQLTVGAIESLLEE